jgi:phosphoglucosamine mutase
MDRSARRVERHADIGIALDGDADRCLAVDTFGRIVDGDQILAILALALREQGRLKNDTVVATVMSNLGFVNAMRGLGITVQQTKVGDRYVLEAMKAGGFILGGEQSGHIVMLEHATTGDGVLTALHLMNRMATSGQSLAQLASVMTRLPQVLINVPDVDKKRAASDPQLSAAVEEAQAELGDSGRVLLRPSGTEALVRVMVEPRAMRPPTRSPTDWPMWSRRRWRSSAKGRSGVQCDEPLELARRGVPRNLLNNTHPDCGIREPMAAQR